MKERRKVNGKLNKKWENSIIVMQAVYFATVALLHNIIDHNS